MSCTVISPGFYSTIQDRGRFGLAEYGVPTSGVMDSYLAKVANLLVGNQANEAVMEITMLGPELEFSERAFVVVSGLGAQVSLNNEEVELNNALKVDPGDTLKIAQITEGIRAYLAVKGGFQTKRVLRSRSFYGNITASAHLEKGDTLPIADFKGNEPNAFASLNINQEKYDSEVVNVFKGPEWGRLPEDLQSKLLMNRFSISKNNTRQAYQLNEKLENELDSMLTQPVLPGTVQLTPKGNIMILMRDAQTTGGYPRIFQLNEYSMDCLAQKRENDPVQFKILD